jgi:hypothetical protein
MKMKIEVLMKKDYSNFNLLLNAIEHKYRYGSDFIYKKYKSGGQYVQFFNDKAHKYGLKCWDEIVNP